MMMYKKIFFTLFICLISIEQVYANWFKDVWFSLFYKRKSGRVEVIRVRPKTTEFHDIVARGETEKITPANLENEIILNAQNSSGDTPLHVAIEHKSGGCLLKLLEAKKININAQNNDGNTPLHIALREGYLVSITQLIKKKANSHVPNNAGIRPCFLMTEYIEHENLIEHKTIVDKKGLRAGTTVNLSANLRTVKKIKKCQRKECRRARKPSSEALKAFFEKKNKHNV